MQQSRLLAGTGRTRTRHGEPVLFEEGLYQVATQTYAWMVPNGSWGETNLGLIECDGKSVLVDTCWDLNFCKEMLHSAGDVVGRSPIEVVINTHADGDHCWGNQLFSGKEIIATHACIEQMHHFEPKTALALQRGSKWLRRVSFKSIDEFAYYMGRMFEPYDFNPITITDPTHGFSGEHTFCLGGTDIVVMEVGPGHTKGDAFVYVPDRKVVFAGDVAFIGATPVMWSGPLERLLGALQKLLELDADVMVPGHGPLASRADIEGLISYWHFAHEELQLRFRSGMPPHEAARDLVHSPVFGGRPFAGWDSPERMMVNAFTLYRHWGVDVREWLGSLGVLDVMRHQAQLAFSLPDATPACTHRR